MALGLLRHKTDELLEFNRFKRNLTSHFKAQGEGENKPLPQRVQTVKQMHISFKGSSNTHSENGLGYNDLVSLEEALNIRITLLDGDKLLN